MVATGDEPTFTALHREGRGRRSPDVESQPLVGDRNLFEALLRAAVPPATPEESKKPRGGEGETKSSFMHVIVLGGVSGQGIHVYRHCHPMRLQTHDPVEVSVGAPSSLFAIERNDVCADVSVWTCPLPCLTRLVFGQRSIKAEHIARILISAKITAATQFIYHCLISRTIRHAHL